MRRVACKYCSKFDCLRRYYLATEEHKAGQRHLYVVRDPSTEDPRRLESSCITCEIGKFLWSSRYLYGNCTHFNALVSVLSAELAVFIESVARSR